MDIIPQKEQIYIVIDDAAELHTDILTQILEIPKYKRNVAVITVRTTPDERADQIIYFHAFNKQQILQLLLAEEPKERIPDSCTMSNPQLWKAFVLALYGSISQFTRDIKEIRRFANMIWPKYIEPVVEDYGIFNNTKTIHKANMT